MHEATATPEERPCEEDPHAAQRRHGRHRVMLSARLVTPHGLANVVLLDISEGGAMVSSPLPMAKGSHVVLTRGGLEAHGAIVWVDKRRLGIRFDDPIDPALVMDTVSAVAQVRH